MILFSQDRPTLSWMKWGLRIAAFGLLSIPNCTLEWSKYKELRIASTLLALVASGGAIAAEHEERRKLPYQEMRELARLDAYSGILSNEVSAIAALPQAQDYPQPQNQQLGAMPNLTNYPAVLIYGPQGSGKTTFAEAEINRRIAAGHQVIALDPHAAYGSWQGVSQILGKGMNYKELDEALANFSIEVAERYLKLANEPTPPNFQPLTLVCDEFTNWASRCKSSGDFFQAALSDIRKIECFVVFVSHARTLPGLGNAKGFAATRDASLLEIELLGEMDTKTGKASPKFEAWVKLPGQQERFKVQVAQEFPTAPYPKSQKGVLDANYLERMYALEFDLNKYPVKDSPQESVSEENADTEGDTATVSDLDTYPQVDWLPLPSDLIRKLRDTQLPLSRFIKEELKATKPERYRLARKAIAIAIRRWGDFDLMQKFKEGL